MNSCTKHTLLLHFCKTPAILFIFSALLGAGIFCSCSFDYGAAGGPDKNKPDIVMENLEYVRVRGGDPLVRLQADHGERWEERQTMELKDFSFEQMENHGESVNAEGSAGTAAVQLNTGDISLQGGVKIRVNSEDVTISTSTLDWKDKEKTLTGGAGAEVDIVRSDGTSFTGYGFSADARNRTWSFSGEVMGKYVEKKKEKKKENENNEESAGTAQTLPAANDAVPAPERKPPEQYQPISPEDK